jgi:hypothetical protein
MRRLHDTEAAPMIACVMALRDVQDRSAERARQERLDAEHRTAAAAYGLTRDELIEARSIAFRHGYRMAEAVEIVRRSRR